MKRTSRKKDKVPAIPEEPGSSDVIFISPNLVCRSASVTLDSNTIFTVSLRVNMATKGRKIEIVNMKDLGTAETVKKIVEGTYYYYFTSLNRFADYKTDTLAIADLDAMELAPKTKLVLELLQDRCRLLQKYPIVRLRRKTAFLNVVLPKDKLKYQQERDEKCEGFFSALESSKKKTKKMKQDGNSNTRKFGQVKPFLNKFEWYFQWSDSTENLKKILQSDTVIGFNNLPCRERREILDHLVAEFFIYFRRSIPARYLDYVLTKFVNEFKCVNDQTESGFVRIISHLKY